MQSDNLNSDYEVSSLVGELASDQSLMRRMNDPVASSIITGPCGDTMEFYLVIINGVLEEVSYYTDGCEFTRACGAWIARYATGMSVDAALGVNARKITEALAPLPESHRHCPILAVSTFYRALADYLMKP
ncbi:MAG: iron-sulfur cluster assembly scaffold protein [Lentisphaeria bacterium]